MTATPPPSSMTPSNAARRRALARLGLPAIAGAATLGTGMAWPLHALAQSASSTRPAGAERLVSLGGGITEVVYALGAEGMLVGTDTTSLYPVAAQNTPKVGYLRSLSAEGLLSLRPTTLVASSEAGPPLVLEQLRRAGVRIELVAVDHTWAQVQRSVEAVGRATRKAPEARTLLARLDAEWASVQSGIAQANTPAKPKVLFILSHTGTALVSGEGTAAHAVIGFMGARNAMSGFTGYRPLTAEAVVAAAPDVVLLTTQGLTAIGGVEQFWSNRPEWRLTPAWRQRQKRETLVHRDALELLGFTPRLPAVVRELHQLVLRS